jgi:hypothetical protein
MTSGEASTATDKVAAMLKQRVAPELRAMGFKGSGQNYHLPVPGHFALLGFQKARFGTRHDVMFTVNLLACSHADWAALAQTKPYYGEKPIAGAMYPPPVWGQRIGFLMPDPHDHWWHVLDDTDSGALAEEVIDALREYGVPALRAQLPRD